VAAVLGTVEKNHSQKKLMVEQCQKCRKLEQKYIIIDVAEFRDSITAEEEDTTEVIHCYGITLCRKCWMDVKNNSSILDGMIRDT
jgi:hypothetical protein